MPITRRRRANPPDQPENNNPTSEQAQENGAEVFSTEQTSAFSQMPIPEGELPQSLQQNQERVPGQPLGADQETVQGATPTHAGQEAQPEQAASARIAENPYPAQQIPPPYVTPSLPPSLRMQTSPSYTSLQLPSPNPNHQNGERFERSEYNPTPIEGGRRTARGELFRRPPQPPVVPQGPAPTSAPLQPPSHEITLPMGNLLHLAYNPGYTGSDEARSALLQKLSQESKAGGRARCWSCGALAIVYDRWNTRSKTFGEVGIAFCEICGVWSVM